MRDIFESLIVFSVMTGLLLPTRLLFVEYVSDDWFGSFGVISLISIAVIILVKKKKLGSFGLIFERQIYKFQKGKRGILVFLESTVLLLILGGMIFAINQGNSVYSDLKIQSEHPSSAEQILESTSHWSTADWFVGFLMFPVALLTAFPQMSASIAHIDQSMNGGLLHFYTVGFVEYVELVGILIYYRISFRKKFITIPSLYSKTPI